MKSAEIWHPTKYEILNGKLRGTQNPEYLSISSRLIADQIAQVYSEWIPRYTHGILADVGCGFLPMYAFYRPYVSEVLAIDWPGTFHTCPHIDILADLNKTPIPGVADGSVDTVLCSDVLEHLYYPQKFLTETHRILRPEGILLLNVPFHYWVHEGPDDYFRYTPFALKRMVEDAGLELLEFRTIGSGVDVVADFAGKIAATTMKRTGKFWAKVIQKMPDLFRKLPLLKIIVRRSSEGAFALGYFVAARKNG